MKFAKKKIKKNSMAVAQKQTYRLSCRLMLSDLAFEGRQSCDIIGLQSKEL